MEFNRSTEVELPDASLEVVLSNETVPGDQEANAADIGTRPETEARVADGAGASHLPSVIINNRPFRDWAADTARALENASLSLDIYRRAGQLVTLVNEDDNRRSIRAITASDLCLTLSEAANFYRNKEGVLTHVQPPMALINNLLSRRDLNIRILGGMTEVPVLREDGSIVTTPGYDEATRLYYSPSASVEKLSIPESMDNPSALTIVNDVIADFPFEDDASKANAIALLLTPLVRPLIAGCVPMALINGTNPGTGKGLLTSVASLIATGAEASVEAAPQSDDEWRKKITSALKAGRNFIVWDNLRGTLKAAPLEAALTTAAWTDRVLGTNDNVSLPQRATWVATGNNVRLGTDMLRRCYQIRLIARSARPWQEAGFRHPELLAWVRENRGELLMALLTLASSWFVDGCPKPEGKALGSFEAWTRVIGGILQHAGVESFLGNLDDMYGEADDEDEQWEHFLRALKGHFGSRPFTVAQVVQATTGAGECAGNSLAAAMPLAMSSQASNIKWRLGKAFSARLKTRFGPEGLYLSRPNNEVDPHTKAARWRVSSDADSQLQVVA